MKIKDLKPHMENITLVGRVLSVTQPIEINMKKYAYAVLEDGSGEIGLNLWREQVAQVEEGDLVKIKDAFVHVKRGVKQISTWSNIEKGSLKDLDDSVS